MQESSLHKAIYNLGSVKKMAKKLGVQREHIYAWMKGISRVPLEYALQIDYLTGGEIDWKELVPFHIAQRLKHLTLQLPKFDLPPCELVYVSINRIRCPDLDYCYMRVEPGAILLHKKRPICIDLDNSIIFGSNTLALYKQSNSRTIPAWRISLSDLAKGNYDSELLVKNFFISERIAIGIALENYLGKRQGQRNDLQAKLKKKSETDKKMQFYTLLMQHSAQVRSAKRVTLRQLVANRLGFLSHFTYQNAKKIKLNGCTQLVRIVDQKQLAISMAARLSKLSIVEQKKVLTQTKRKIIKKSFEITSHPTKVSKSMQSNSVNEGPPVLSNVRCQNS